MIRKFTLRYFWPFLNFYNYKNYEGFFTNYGIDTHLVFRLLNFLLNNKSCIALEINKPHDYIFSITTALSVFKLSNVTLINTEKNLVFSTKHYSHFNNFKKDDIEYDFLKHLGLYHTQFHDNSFYLYNNSDNNSDNNLDFLYKDNYCYSVLIISYNDLLSDHNIKLLQNLNIMSVLLLNNDSKLLKTGDDNVRNVILKFGYIYLDRLNNKHDFFVLSELINGFPSKDLRYLNTSRLQKYVSIPRNLDYNIPS